MSEIEHGSDSLLTMSFHMVYYIVRESKFIDIISFLIIFSGSITTNSIVADILH